MKAFFAFLMLGFVGACADNNVAPMVQSAAFKAPAAFDVVVGVQTFRVYNSEGVTERIGDHVLYIPAGAICDPQLSTYGETEWDKPCEALQGSILITATMMRDNENHPYIDFQPALRFDPTKQVMLFLRNGLSSRPTELIMKYCNNLGYCEDESVEDASLSPFRVGRTSVLGRRIKHFSGYMVTSGMECEGTLTEEPNGTWMCWVEDGEGGGMTRRSGYMVASGMDDDSADRADDKGAKKSDSQDQQ